MTQPAFSRRIQSLEEWVGTPLFERSKRGVTLTKAGEVFTDQIPELIHSLYTLKSDTLEAAGNKQPSLVFSVNACFVFLFCTAFVKNRVIKLQNLVHFVFYSDSLNACEKIDAAGRFTIFAVSPSPTYASKI